MRHCQKNYNIALINNKRPDLFLTGNRDEWGSYTNPPIIQAIIRGGYTTIKFFVENNINWKESRPRSRDSGSEYSLGGNVLTYLPGWDNDRRIHNYLAAQGVEEEIDISDQIIMVGYGLDSINVWLEPGYNTEIIRRINKETKLKPIKTFLNRFKALPPKGGFLGIKPLGTNKIVLNYVYS